MAEKEKFDRKDLKEPDQFFETVGKVNRYLEENKSQAALIAGGLLAVFLLLVGGRAYIHNARENAAAAFARALNNLEFNSEAAAKAGFDGLTGASNSGPYGELARLYKADLAARDGDYETATAEYEAFLESADTDYLRQAALMGEAYALEMSGAASKALDNYAKAGDIDGPFTKHALLARLRVADNTADKAAAADAIERLLEKNFSGLNAEELSQRLEELRKGAA